MTDANEELDRVLGGEEGESPIRFARWPSDEQLDDAILAVEAEAAQGAAPLPQATVDLFCEVAASGVVHQAEPPGIDYVTVQVDMDTWRGIQAWAAGLSEGAAPLDEIERKLMAVLRHGHDLEKPGIRTALFILREKSEGAAPRTDRAEGLAPGANIRIDGHLLVHVAACECEATQAEVARLSRPSATAPRAEGLDVPTLVQAYANVEGAGAWTVNRREPAAWVERRVTDILDEYARLSRPSDERVPESEERPVCKRFRHDEHCIDEPHG